MKALNTSMVKVIAYLIDVEAISTSQAKFFSLKELVNMAVENGMFDSNSVEQQGDVFIDGINIEFYQ